jgi:GAF domain-containing protein
LLLRGRLGLPVQIPDYTFDEGRLKALADLDILDTAEEPGFDAIVELAAQICEAPISLVSLVAGDRQWFKARVGFASQETDLSSSVCAHALIEPDLLVIPDLSADPRTAANPLVTGDAGIRFYAGAPLRMRDGQVLGSLCVIDGAARPGGLTGPQAAGLRNLARQVVSQLELRAALAEKERLLTEQRHAEARRNGLLLLGDRLRHATSVMASLGRHLGSLERRWWPPALATAA